MFHETSTQCYEWLKNQPFVKEESITDWLLYNISRDNDKICYKAFSRNEEALNGSDWEWWFLTNTNSVTKAYRLLIQAKKLKPHEDNYPLIAYSNKNGLQIDLLIENALKRNALPLYAYYSCCTPDIKEQLINIDYIKPDLLKWCETCKNGCFLTSAFSLKEKVFNFPRKKIVEKNLINSSFGISIFDKLFYSIPIDSDNLFKMLNQHFLSFCTYKQIPASGIEYNYNDLPQYVKTLIEKHPTDDLSWYEKEFDFQLESLSGVVIIDIRKE